MHADIIERLDRIEAKLNEEDKPLTLQETAAYLDISPSYLYKLTASQRIPHYKPHGKRVYFLKADLNAYLLQNRVRPMDEIEQEAATRVALSLDTRGP